MPKNSVGRPDMDFFKDVFLVIDYFCDTVEADYFIRLLPFLLMQSDGGSATTPSLRSQKIARAKWEFLFGGQTEESRRSKGTVSAAAVRFHL